MSCVIKTAEEAVYVDYNITGEEAVYVDYNSMNEKKEPGGRRLVVQLVNHNESNSVKCREMPRLVIHCSKPPVSETRSYAQLTSTKVTGVHLHFVN